MSADEWIGYGSICVAVTWLTAALVAKVHAIRAEAARAKTLPPLPRDLPQRIPARVVTPESCDCDDCNALVEQIRLTVAIAVARAEAASIDREWAELNGGAS